VTNSQLEELAKDTRSFVHFNPHPRQRVALSDTDLHFFQRNEFDGAVGARNKVDVDSKGARPAEVISKGAVA
jgi:hypothetical protein